jgi:hypothetical protein
MVTILTIPPRREAIVSLQFECFLAVSNSASAAAQTGEGEDGVTEAERPPDVMSGDALLVFH